MDTNIIGTAAGVLTSIAMLPQLIKVLKEKEVEDISWVMSATLITGLSLWVWFGILKEEWSIIISNGFAVLVNLVLFFCLMKYKKD